ncbi:MAG: FtsX-like permease family protein [Candidatus Neomarinimicrobiota bacterium]
MLTAKLAIKNLLGAGLRTWLNVAVTSFSFVVIILMSGLYKGIIESATRTMADTEVAGGAYWHPSYDPQDPFTLEDSHGPLPREIAAQVSAGEAMPVLVVQGALYHEGRMVPVMFKGLPTGQGVVALPSHTLEGHTGSATPVLIGTAMAKSAQLREGDQLIIRWRDAHGTYDATDAEVVAVMQVENIQVDAGQIWMPLERLQQLAAMPGEATFAVVKQGAPLLAETGDWLARDVAYLLKDYIAMAQSKEASARILYFILLTLAGLGIFNSQVLSIFRRRKEIGTLMALGMARSRVVGLFTVEGGLHSVLAMALGIAWGGPLIILMATKGIPLPYDPADFGLVIGQRLFPVYGPGLIVGTTLLVAAIVTVVSYIPSRRITKMKPTEALTGRGAQG